MRYALFACLLSTLPAAAEDPRLADRTDTDTHFTMPVYRTRAEWEQRSRALRRQILSAAGLYELPARPALRREVFGRIEGNDYTIDKALIETLPGYFVGANIYRPRLAGRRPGILAMHGHWNGGRLENTDNFSGPALGVHLARNGFVALAIDMTGYADTKQTPHRFSGDPDHLRWSFGPLPLQLWNAVTALDFLASLPDVDPRRLGATGASGGGTQTFLLSAIDRRIRFAAPVNMVSAYMQGGCVCENSPGLRIGAFNVEFAAMMAPRPLLLVAATGDWTKNVPREEFPAVRHIYSLYGAPDKVETEQFDYPHNFNRASREAVYRFLRKAAGLPPADVSERPYGPHSTEQLSALTGRSLPAGAVDFAGVFAAWKALPRGGATPADRLRAALGADWPARVSAEEKPGRPLLLTRAEAGDSVSATWHPGAAGRAVVLLHPRAVDAAGFRTPDGVLALNLFGTEPLHPPPDPQLKHFLTFHRSDAAEQVRDILTALRWLEQQKIRRIEIVGFGDTATLAAYAAAVAPFPVTARLRGAAGVIEAPGVEAAGGWASVQAALNGR